MAKLQIPLVFSKNPNLVKLLSLGLILFFILLSDAILSYWVPNFMQESLGSSVMMGLMMSFSSIVGFLIDAIFPQILRGINVKKLIFFGCLSGIAFILALLKSTFTPYVLFFLIAMAVWGIYYELLWFGQQQFVSDSIPLRLHSSAWGVLSVFRSLAYFLGPLLAGAYLLRGTRSPLYVAAFFSVVGMLLLFITSKKHTRPIAIDIDKVNLWREMGHWKMLFSRVWPVVVMTITTGIIDSIFWTTGAVMTERLSAESVWGGFFLPVYSFPPLFMGLIVARLGIFKGKKRLSQKLMFFASLFLIAFLLTKNVYITLFLVLIHSILLSMAYPMVDAVYSDVIARMGRERNHLIGLSSSGLSMAYIIGPSIGGVITNFVGERNTFVVVGVLGLLVSIFLLIFTPKKIRLPQGEIQAWED